MTTTGEWENIFEKIVKYTSFHDVSNIQTVDDVRKVCDEIDNKAHKKGVQSTLTKYHRRSFEDIYYQKTQQKKKIKHKIQKQEINREYGKAKTRRKIIVYRDAKGRFMKKPHGN